MEEKLPDTGQEEEELKWGTDFELVTAQEEFNLLPGPLLQAVFSLTKYLSSAPVRN